MSEHRISKLCLTLGSLFLVSIGFGLFSLIIGTTENGSGAPRYDSNETQLPSLIGCPSRNFMRVQGKSLQIIENEDIPHSPRCFTLPQQTFPHVANCFQTTKEKCTPLTAALKCYNPGECPKYHVRHSVFLNTISKRNGKVVTSQAVCCW